MAQDIGYMAYDLHGVEGMTGTWGVIFTQRQIHAGICWGMAFLGGRFVCKACQESETIKFALDQSAEGHCHHLS